MKPYPAYKDSGVEWLGVVPAGWKPIKLRHLCSKIGSGTTPLGGRLGYQDEGVLFIRSQNVHFSGLRLDDVAFITSDVHQAMSVSVVHPGDVLLNITGASIGRCTTVPRLFPLANVNQHVCILRPISTRVAAKFLEFALRSARTQSLIDVLNQGSSRQGLNFSQIAGFHLALPPLSEQRGIVAFLDRETGHIDDLVSRYETLISLLQERRQSLISHTVTKGLDPNAPMKDSGVEWLGEVPAEWEPGVLKYLCEVVAGQSPSSTEVEEIDLGLLPFLQGNAEFGSTTPLPAYCCESAPRRCVPGDILISVRAPVGALNIAERVYGIGRGLCAVRAKAVEAHFLWWLLKASGHQLHAVAVGTTYDAVTAQDIDHLWCAVPPLSEQRAIAAFLDQETARIDELISKATKAIGLLKERRTALISAVVTGKIDVRGGVLDG